MHKFVLLDEMKSSGTVAFPICPSRKSRVTRVSRRRGGRNHHIHPNAPIGRATVPRTVPIGQKGNRLIGRFELLVFSKENLHCCHSHSSGCSQGTQSIRLEVYLGAPLTFYRKSNSGCEEEAKVTDTVFSASWTTVVGKGCCWCRKIGYVGHAYCSTLPFSSSPHLRTTEMGSFFCILIWEIISH